MEEPFSCHRCGKVFSNYRGLNVHLTCCLFAPAAPQRCAAFSSGGGGGGGGGSAHGDGGEGFPVGCASSPANEDAPEIAAEVLASLLGDKKLSVNILAAGAAPSLLQKCAALLREGRGDGAGEGAAGAGAGDDGLGVDGDGVGDAEEGAAEEGADVLFGSADADEELALLVQAPDAGAGADPQEFFDVCCRPSLKTSLGNQLVLAQ